MILKLTKMKLTKKKLWMRKEEQGTFFCRMQSENSELFEANFKLSNLIPYELQIYF